MTKRMQSVYSTNWTISPKKVMSGIEPPSQNLQFYTLPICYITKNLYYTNISLNKKKYKKNFAQKLKENKVIKV